MADPLEPRPVIRFLAAFQESALRKHDKTRGEQGWLRESPEWLVTRLVEETEELMLAIQAFRHENDNAGQVIKECADVANFAAMIADVVLRQWGGDRGFLSDG
jgi:NTP pyrophosphatase (non-canonical NTP hydrolase)